VLANFTSGEGDANAGILCFAVALAGILLLCLGQQQGKHGVRIQNPDLCHGGTLIAGIEMLGVASDLMVDQVCLLILPGRLNANAVVSGADRFADCALVFYGGAIGQEGIGTAVGICHGMPQQAGKVDFTGPSIGHRIACVHFLCCLIESGEGIQVTLLCFGEDGGLHWGCLRCEYCSTDGGQTLRGLPASHPGQRCRWCHPSSGHRQGSSVPTSSQGGG